MNSLTNRKSKDYSLNSTSGFVLPALISDAGESAEKRFVEFFTANIRNANTRKAYLRSINQFLDWCNNIQLTLEQIEPVNVSAYIELLLIHRSPATVKQHLAALKMLFDYLVVGQVIPFNPASAVRGPKHKVKKGKTPVLFAEDANLLFDSIDTSSVMGLRDKAILSVMTYSFARVGAVTKMKVKDYYTQNTKAWFILHEKGGKEHRVPAHHKATASVEAYLDITGIRTERDKPLFRSSGGRARALTDQPLSTLAVWQMIKRRAKQAGLPEEICCHTFRATGITNYLQNGGTIETAAQIAAHESTRTTQLYNRVNEEVDLGEIEKIRF